MIISSFLRKLHLNHDICFVVMKISLEIRENFPSNLF